ncbi:MAG: hypothetical protein ABIS86_22770 [Streptosporangiaceae bacterium]
MQPARVILAAIFFVIAALIMIPAFRSGSNSSDASQSPSVTVTPTVTTTSAPPKATQPVKTVTPTPKPTVTPTVTPTPTKTTKAPVPVPTLTVSPRPATVPLAIAFGKVACPSHRITVKVSNDGETTQGYSINRDGSDVITDQLGPHTSRTSELTLREDRKSTVKVTQDRKAKATRTYTANCAKATAAPGGSDGTTPPRTRLPKTGADDAVLFARIATAGASLLTGVIILWWGGLWPRRKEAMFGTKRGV